MLQLPWTQSEHTVWAPNPQTRLYACRCQVGLKVADLQEQSAVNRKQLADTTREFKRSTAAAADSEYVLAVAGLLKRYQEEIDALTRRAKHGRLMTHDS